MFTGVRPLNDVAGHYLRRGVQVMERRNGEAKPAGEIDSILKIMKTSTFMIDLLVILPMRVIQIA